MVHRDMARPISRKPYRQHCNRLVEAQGGLCLYCLLPFGSEVRWKHRRRTLRAEIDHLVPVAWKDDNRTSNLAAACQVCNSVKADGMYDTIEAARDAIAQRTTALVVLSADGAVPIRRKPQLACVVCGRMYEPKREWQVYCGNPCRQRAYFDRRVAAAAKVYQSH